MVAPAAVGSVEVVAEKAVEATAPASLVMAEAVDSALGEMGVVDSVVEETARVRLAMEAVAATARVRVLVGTMADRRAPLD